VAVIVAFALARDVGTGKPEATPSGPPPPITAAAPPANPAADGPCAQVLSALPVQLGPLAPRVVHTEPDSPNVVAWGDPAVALRCGVLRPPQFVPTSQLILSGVYWLPVKTKNATVFTAVDRAVYVEVTVPTKQAYIPLPQLGQAIASKLKPVCAVPEDNRTAGGGQLCVNRK
jgi:Protein of unknown function (DUF3515)